MAPPKCMMCLEHYNDGENLPLLLPCCCTLCRSCVRKVLKSDKSMTCPRCSGNHESVDVDQLTVNILGADFIEGQATASENQDDFINITISTVDRDDYRLSVPVWATIQRVKDFMQFQHGYNSKRIRLIFEKKQLQDEKTLLAQGIKENYTLYMLLIFRGGGNISTEDIKEAVEEQVVQELGRGSFGEAVLVKRGSQNLVLKKIRMENMNPKTKWRQLQEANLLKNIDHPNIVSYKGQDMRDQTLYLYMEYCEGGDMLAAIRTQKQANQHFPENTVKEWATQLASALQHIHASRVLHRDIKPANIFLSSDKNLKLGDFGLARVLSDSSFVAATMLGTLRYLAPEILRDGGYDAKADMYSFGVSLFHIAALIPPRPGKEVPATYSDALRSLIVALMSQSPEDRPSAEEVLTHSALAPPTPASPNTKDDFINITIMTTEGTEYPLRVAASATIRAVKDAIQLQHSTGSRAILLHFRGQVLKDYQTLSSCGVKSGDTLEMRNKDLCFCCTIL